MKTFFNDVLNEVQSRYGKDITLQTTEETSILKQVLTEYEAGTLGRKFEKAKRRMASKKSVLKTEEVIEVGKIYKKVYANRELYLDSEDSLMLLKFGFKKGATYNARGNSGGAFNETLSNEGVLILDKFNLSLEDLALVLYYRTLNTELGNQQKDTPRMGIDIPDEIPRVSQDLYISCYLAAKSSIAKLNRSKLGVSKIKDFELETRMAYGGSVGDLKSLSDKIISANTCYVYDVDLNKVVEIPRLQMVNWSNSAGSGDNAGDTVILVTSKNGNILYDGWSDKKSLNDIQGNGTMNDDFTKMMNNITKMLELKLINLKTTNSSIEIIQKYQIEINELEDEYKNAAFGEARYFQSLSKDDKHLISLWMDIQETYYKKNGTTNHVDTCKTMDDYAESSNIIYLNYLITKGVNKSATRNKVINRMALMHRAWYNRNKITIPETLDTKGIVSIARYNTMIKHSELIGKLNNFVVNRNNNIKKPLGEYLMFYDTINFLKINKISKPKNDTHYSRFLLRNTNVIMGGTHITPGLIKSTLGIKGITQYLDDFKFESTERIMYDTKKKYVTGKVINLFTIKDGVRNHIGEKTYRSKQGFTGKTSNTISWSSEIQAEFKNN